MRRGLLSAMLVAAMLGIPAGVGVGYMTNSSPNRSEQENEDTKAWQTVPALRTPNTTSERPLPPEQTQQTAARMAKILDEAPTVKNQKLRASVIDVHSGQELATSENSKPYPPASSLKVLSAGAILGELNDKMTFKTSLMKGSGDAEIVLLGGGDALLSPTSGNPQRIWGRAGLRDLAREALKQLPQNQKLPPKMTLLVDDSLFSEEINPAWPDGDLQSGQMTRLSPIAVGSAFETPGAVEGPRDKDPAMKAASYFRSAFLEEASKAGKGTPTLETRRGKAPQGAQTLASVESANVEEQINHALLTSDNYVMETLTRMAAIHAGKAATSQGVKEFLAQELPQLTQYSSEVSTTDASGLSIDNQVTARSMASAVQKMLTSTNEAQRSEADAFPIAGLSGTLTNRFQESSGNGPKGAVRAKTGTLNATTALTGYMMSREGRAIAFSLAYTDIDGFLPEARTALESVVTKLYGVDPREKTPEKK